MTKPLCSSGPRAAPPLRGQAARAVHAADDDRPSHARPRPRAHARVNGDHPSRGRDGHGAQAKVDGDHPFRGRDGHGAQAKVDGDRIAGRRDWRSDAGSATVWVLAAGAVTIAVALAIATMGAAIVARHRAQSAADLAALAGALVALDGEEAACGRAAALAASNGARLAGCRLDGLDVVLTVETAPAGPAALAGAARASARAGPVDTTAAAGRAGPIIRGAVKAAGVGGAGAGAAAADPRAPPIGARAGSAANRTVACGHRPGCPPAPLRPGPDTRGVPTISRLPRS